MISDGRLDQALAYLVETAAPAAKARAERLYLEEATKHVRAKLMAEKSLEGLSAAAQEREACATDAYRTHLEGLRAAIEVDEGMRYRREAESAVIEAWRTYKSFEKSMKV